jgi:retinol dehydrogenase 12
VSHVPQDMTGRTVVVTGATDGIGRVTAERLAQRGARVAIVGRNAAKVRATVDAIAGAAPGAPPPTGIVADLSVQAEVRRAAAELDASLPAVDVLVNNAGAIFSAHQSSADGIERTFALNHLGYFLFTKHLLPALRRGTAPRIVVVASEAHRGASLVLDDLTFRHRRWTSWGAYSESKLANIMFTYALARRLRGTGISANCLHPGFVRTQFGSTGGMFGMLLRMVMQVSAISVERGAATSVFLAADRTVSARSGEYYDASKARRSTDGSYDAEAQEALWVASERLVGEPFTV